MARAVSVTCDLVWERCAFAFILLASAGLRFWQVETPSLWFDEVLVAIVAKLPWLAIVQRSMAEDFHPPVFYFLAKSAMAVSSSEFILRLPQVVFGVAAVWAAHAAGRAMLPGGGLLLATVVGFQPWLLVLSRQLRPYSIIFFASLVGFWLLWRGATRKSRGDFFLSGAALGVQLPLHFSCVLALGGAGLTAICLALAGRMRWKDLLAFCAVPAMAMLVTGPYLVSLLFREHGIAAVHTFSEVAVTIGDRLWELLWRENIPWLRGGLAWLSVIGFAVLLRRDRLLAFVSLGWVAFPVLALAAMRYSSYFNPWHLTFLLPGILLWQASALRAIAALPGIRRVDGLAAGALALGLAAAGMWWYPGPAAPHYYQPDSYGDSFRQAAMGILGTRAPGTVWIYPQSSTSGPLNWYLDRFSEPNPARVQRVGPEEERILLGVLDGRSGSRALTRHPVQPLGALAFREHVVCRPEELLARVYRTEGLACQPVLEPVVISTREGVPGVAEFVYENTTPGPQDIRVDFGFANTVEGGRFTVSLAFDDEPSSASFESVGPDVGRFNMLACSRDAPYRRLVLRFTLLRPPGTWSFIGENLDCVHLLDFKIAVTPGRR